MANTADIKLSITTSAETKGVKDTVSALEGLKATITQVAGGLVSLQGLVATAFAALSGGALAVGIKASINNANELREAAIRAGQGIEQFSLLAGGKGGEAADALAKGARFLSQWMGKVGLQGQDLTKTFLDQADAISKTADGDERLRMATERFGRSGSELLPILMKGRDGLLAQMQVTRQLGLVIDTEFATHAHEFNKNLKLMSNFGFGIFNELARDILPYLLQITGQVVEWMKENSLRIRDFIKESISVAVEAWRESKLFDLISLLIEAGFEEGTKLGISAVKDGFSKLFDSDFLIIAAKMGKILAESLLYAVKLPVDFLQAGFETFFTWFYTQWVDTNTKAAAFFLDTFTKAFNAIVKTSPALMFTVKPLQFDAEAFKKGAKDVATGGVEPDFGTSFATAQKSSGEAIKTILGYLDEQIAKTKQILAGGNLEGKQDAEKVSAYTRLVTLFNQLKSAADARNASEKKSDAHQDLNHDPTKSDFEEQRKQLEFQIQANELMVQNLHLRGQILENGQRTVGSLNEEAEALKTMLTNIEQLVRQRQKLTDDMEGRGLLTKDEARQQELKDAQELLKIQGQLLQLKEQTNDFTFFESFGRGLQDLIGKTKNVAASMGKVLSDGVSNGLHSISTGIWDVIDGTKTWGDIFRNVARQVISQMIEVALVQGVVRAAMMATAAVAEMVGAKTLAISIRQFAVSGAAGAAKSSEDSGWVGLLVYLGVLAATVGAITAMAGGFESGGVIPGGEQLIRVNEGGRTESVLNARATSFLGTDMINALNSGASGVLGLESRIAANMQPPTAPDMQPGFAGRQGAAGVPAGQSGNSNRPVSLHAVFVDSRNSQAARDHLASAAGRAQIIEIVRDSKTEIGLR